ncbi:hypothetical protein M2139_000810 [Enterococcus sp. PF1-24]|nr:hypothetical protein [Enterococcus sp. PF1-24]MDH6400927.1 hypothetical protein [Enterococcus sp. PF1-24]
MALELTKLNGFQYIFSDKLFLILFIIYLGGLLIFLKTKQSNLLLMLSIVSAVILGMLITPVEYIISQTGFTTYFSSVYGLFIAMPVFLMMIVILAYESKRERV